MHNIKIKNKIYSPENPLHVLLSQNKPLNYDKCKYKTLEKIYPVKFFFNSFINLTPINISEYKKQKIEITDFNNIVFTSKNAVDYYFKLLSNLRIKPKPINKYFCLREVIATYLRHFIDYKKRKVFFNKTATIQSLVEMMLPQPDTSCMLYVISENQQDQHLLKLFKKNKISYEMIFLYRTVFADIKPLLSTCHFDIICFTTPSSIHSLWYNDPSYKSKKFISGTFGEHTLQAAKNLNLPISFFAPTPQHRNLCDVFEEFLKKKIIAK